MTKLLKSNKYGNVEVLDEADRHAVRVRFVDTGYETAVSRSNLNAGKVTDHPRKAARTEARKREEARRSNEKAKHLRTLTPKQTSTPPKDVDVGTIHETANHGQVVVGKYHSHGRIDVAFLNTGYQTTTQAATLRAKGRILDPLAATVFGVGRRGIGKHKAHDRGGDTPKYRVWRAMLRRCYYTLPSGKRAHPSYVGVTVCEDWLDFQEFAEWYEQNYPSGAQPGEYQLDKDLETKGNKVYSPEGCRFITQAANLRARAWR